MQFKVGDKVRFLNDHGGGIVTKVISASMVNVRIEDGFEIPTVVSELIKEEDQPRISNNMMMGMPTSFAREENARIEEKEEELVFDDRMTPLEVFRAKGDAPKGIYLAYVPHDQKWLLTGLLDVFLMNYSDYEVLFSLFLRKPNGAWEGVDYDALKPNSKILLDSIRREDIERWSYGILQVLYHKEVASKVLNPVSSVFSFKPAKLYRENAYQDSAIITGKSFMLVVNEIASQPAAGESVLDEKFDEAIKQQSAKPKQPDEVISKHKTGPREAVVDLHIGELLDNYSKMSNTEMLNYQLNYFVRCIESAIKMYLTKVTFIHGVGDGVLKSKMLEILKAYNNVRTKDASMHKFGYGATEVLIWHGHGVE